MSSWRVLVYNVSPCILASAFVRAPIKIMLKMCSSSLQRKTFWLYRCKRKKENQGPRRKYERNNMPGALEVADVSAIFIRTKLCCMSLNIFPLLLSVFSYSHISIFFCFHHVAKTHPHLSFRTLSFSFSFHTVNRYITHSLPSRFLALYFSFLFLSLAFSHTLSFFLSHFHSRSRSFALIEYNSYVITGGRHPMSISSGMRDERFSPYHLDDLN